ncbi:alpha-ketoglutarate-dependent taurine dioxygenase [Phlyctema vagabunda]|uniref:Alpha-ketoglutarate-dependent taurine dioxygenase n=1 Tax=Phlyctema vagabunda TaxID=108571 RepID=A0ABR4PAR2_9HELO
MAPSARENDSADKTTASKALLELPGPAVARMTKAGIDLSNGYPWRRVLKDPVYWQDLMKIRAEPWTHEDPASRADKSKSALLSAAKATDITTHIGTEFEGIQLKDLTDQQRDELALLIAERGVVVFRNQDLSPQQQLELGRYYGVVDELSTAPQVPGNPGAAVIWPSWGVQNLPAIFGFRKGFGSSFWHADSSHEPQPPGYTHLHNDTAPSVGGDTLWASGYAAYEKLSPEFRKMLDGKFVAIRSFGTFADKDNPTGPQKHLERVQPLIRVHPVTGWKTLFVSRAFTHRIIGLDKAESDLILNYLFDVFEKNLDIQVRIRWGHGTSVLWDNRSTIHNATWDYNGKQPRHGTLVISFAEKPYYDPAAPTRREALGLLDDSEQNPVE